MVKQHSMETHRASVCAQVQFIYDSPPRPDHTGNRHFVTDFRSGIISARLRTEHRRNPSNEMPLHHEYINPIPYHPTLCDSETQTDLSMNNIFELEANLKQMKFDQENLVKTAEDY
ncbi:Hypothetical predicted protein [Mytilus galloprovincialis]|uniref:Uncharacterized protein n=1 Tax=Mytilus galloprovincialis TaxID=29158 RepID=A0A8B6BHH9_MYTGA|nr:Hypothetical predicted protein [Mytilus galloprovincialis]